MVFSDNGPMTENPDIWLDEPMGMRATWFDHCLLYGPAIEKSVSLFTDVLKFELTESDFTRSGSQGFPLPL